MDDFDGETSKRNPVFCTLVNASLDLDRDDLGHPGHPGLWQRLLADRRPVHRRGLYCPDCLTVRGVSAWMYVYERRGTRIAAHHNPHHDSHHGESDERKAYKERYARAAESAGHTAEVDAVGADGRRRTDVLVTGAGGRQYGFEAQLSYITAATARSRDAAASADGITAVWHTVDPKSPLIDVVRWTRADDLPAAAIRDDRDLLVRGGVRTLDLQLCERMPAPCPQRRQGSCGRRHPRWNPRPRQFDELVRDIADGSYVPLTVQAGRALHRFWAPAPDLATYLDNGGTLAEDDHTRQAPAPRRATHRGRPRDAQCAVDRAERRRRRFEHVPPRDRGEAIWLPETTIPVPIPRPPLVSVREGVCSAGRTHCGAEARLYAAGWLCDAHRPGANRR
ncbi:hypothetical protein RMN57_02330 [Kitasatospora sp. CM 4170]|uniref:Competence CoiA family protein n=1 Tax=Kitasatospora aburaviensis TaxID=67265 RepID=A0ABW1EU63_9ACTN|nr:hypothetical protein [Kitasatospora sp. CM 4170]WNM43617.1 hypothetical protein RMN57_02330 [Kitasatospora sp. CM 4170]